MRALGLLLAPEVLPATWPDCRSRLCAPYRVRISAQRPPFRAIAQSQPKLWRIRGIYKFAGGVPFLEHSAWLSVVDRSS
jgi:hypothetical protein